MPVSLTRAAWLGIKRHTDDDHLKTRIDGLLLLSRSDRPACDLPRPVLCAALDAYKAWSESHGIGRS